MKLDIPIPLLALAVCAFGIGVTEFAPMGLLPLIAADLKVSIPTAGLLISGYALGVLVGAPLLTLPTGKIPRKSLLMGLLGLFILGNLISAVSVNYPMLMAGRVVTSLCHGSFFGIGSIVAAGLVEPNRRAGAVAAMFTGLSIANIIGVPFCTWLGQHFGWRAAFWAITVMGVVAAVALQAALPHQPASGDIDVKRELKALASPAVLLALLTTVLSSAAMFTVFTYIAPILQNVTRVSPSFITGVLLVYGVGLTIGNSLGGRYADKSLNGTLIVVLSALTALLLVFAWNMSFPIPAAVTIFAWGIATFATVAPLQTRVMTVAAKSPNLASSMNIGAFNLGNAMGAALGASVIGLGFSYRFVSISAAVLAFLSLALVLFSARRRDQAS
jgi:DHA1 family inner membrane transport protein